MQTTIVTTTGAYVGTLRSLECLWDCKGGLLNTVDFCVYGTVMLLHSTMKQKNGQQGIHIYL